MLNSLRILYSEIIHFTRVAGYDGAYYDGARALELLTRKSHFCKDGIRKVNDAEKCIKTTGKEMVSGSRKSCYLLSTVEIERKRVLPENREKGSCHCTGILY
jgi:hypothetical protein